MLPSTARIRRSVGPNSCGNSPGDLNGVLSMTYLGARVGRQLDRRLQGGGASRLLRSERAPGPSAGSAMANPMG